MQQSFELTEEIIKDFIKQNLCDDDQDRFNTITIWMFLVIVNDELATPLILNNSTDNIEKFLTILRYLLDSQYPREKNFLVIDDINQLSLPNLSKYKLIFFNGSKGVPSPL